MEDHVVAQDAEDDGNDEIVQAVVRGEGADKDKEKKERNEERAADKGERGQLVQDEEANPGDDEIGDD
jgi:hypothetical protein